MNDKSSKSAQEVQSDAADLSKLAAQLALGKDPLGNTLTPENEIAVLEHFLLSAQCLHNKIADVVVAYGMNLEDLLYVSKGYSHWEYDQVKPILRKLNEAEHEKELV